MEYAGKSSNYAKAEKVSNNQIVYSKHLSGDMMKSNSNLTT